MVVMSGCQEDANMTSPDAAVALVQIMIMLSHFHLVTAFQCELMTR